jgi:hypothetical protein
MSFAAFFERARTEAERYGPDPWVFVRELLQNARDAGAQRVTLSAEIIDGRTRVLCSDDGEGMSFRHASDYLFTLYRSSKESDSASVGKFGVGFWSILRFGPERITIRSHHHGDEPWEISLEEGSPRAAQRRPEMPQGTVLVLERSGEDHEVLRRLRDAAIQNGRFLTQRDRPELPLHITVQGESINAPFTLPEPRASFAWRGVRGVVCLGDTPRVELFSRGLRVRAASCLEDLLSSERASDKSRVQFPSIDGVLAPQAILESDELELLLARSDAKEDEALRKLVRRAQKELRGLVREQLAALRPPTMRERLAELLRDVNEAPVWAQVTGAVVGGALFALLAAPLVWQFARPHGGADTEGVTVHREAATKAPTGPSPYHDLASEYFGPQVSPLDPATASSIRLVYSPAEMKLHFGALAIADLNGRGPVVAPLRDPKLAPYPKVDCTFDSPCISVRLEIDQSPGPMRVPIPMGHALVRDSLRFVGASGEQVQTPVLLSEANEAVLLIRQPFRGTLAYQSTPARGAFAPALSTRGPALPPELARLADSLRHGHDQQRAVDQVIKAIADRITYSVDEKVSVAHARAINDGLGLVDRALRIGAGDCDVQNGVAALVLAEAGIEARLVVGLVGRRGQANPWLHAWVEWRDAKGELHFADASTGAPSPPLATREFPPIPGPEIPVAGVATPEDPDRTKPVEASGSPKAGTSMEGSSLSNPDVSSGGAPSWLSRWPTLAAWTDGYDPRGIMLAIASLLALSLLSLTAGAWMIFGGRRPVAALARQTSLGELLQGALRQPLAFRHLPELFTRQLVPTLHGSALSLSEARLLARAGRLYSGHGKHSLPRDAARKGASVIDLGAAEGRAVAGTLGAVDLDELARLRERAVQAPLCRELETIVRESGHRWEFRLVERLDRPLRSIDLVSLGIARRGGTRRVLILSADDPAWIEASSLHAAAPATARFLLLDEVITRLDMPAQGRGDILASAAAAATLESAAWGGQNT